MHKPEASRQAVDEAHHTLRVFIVTGDPEGAAIAADALVDYVEIFTRATIDIAP